MGVKDQRICIVGAGPAGLSAAMYLDRKGYTNYTIYEKSGRVGGKVFSPLVKGSVTGLERTVEMGASKCFGGEPALRECETFGETPHAEGPVLLPRPVKENGTEQRPPLFAKRKTAARLKKAAAMLEKYKGYDVVGHRGTAQGRYEGLGLSPSGRLAQAKGVNARLKDLAMPFSEFLQKNECADTAELWQALFTPFGMGYLEEIPAAYVLKHLDAPTLQQFYTGTGMHTWPDGAQGIWENVNNHLKNPARLNSEVVNIDRKAMNVFVTVNNGRAEPFDKLIVCTPLHAFLHYGNPRPDEERLFGKIRYKNCLVMAVRTAAGRMPDASYTFVEHRAPETCGRLLMLYRRWMDTPDQPLTACVLCNRDGEPGISLQAARDAVLQDLAACGCPVESIERVQDWAAFPHVSPADYAAGWYDEVEELQGWDNTYYAGEIMSCASMDETAAYSRELIERFF